MRATEGGYLVSIGPNEASGWLPSARQHDAGDRVLAQFVTVKNDVAILQELSSKRSSYARLRDALKEEQALTASLKFKRATDLLVPPVDDVQINIYRSEDCNFAQLCAELSQAEFTGCVKSFNQACVSRAGALLYQGRVVGCIFGNKSINEPLPVVDSLELMRKDALSPGAEIRVYELPEDVVLSSASLFLGYPLARNDSLSPIDYLHQMRDWLRNNQQTACFACSLQTTTWLDFYHDGNYIGTFCVEDQKFYRTEGFLPGKLSGQDARIELALLSPHVARSGDEIGYSLCAS